MMTIERALRYGEVAAGLALAIVRLVKSGKAERVEKILPSELLTTLERARAELEAEARYAELGRSSKGPENGHSS